MIVVLKNEHSNFVTVKMIIPGENFDLGIIQETYFVFLSIKKRYLWLDYKVVMKWYENTKITNHELVGNDKLANVFTGDSSWYVPHESPIITKQLLLGEQIIWRTNF